MAVHEAVQWLGEQTGVAPQAMAIGIEPPRGVLVDTLIERGFCVFALNPKQLDRFRDRFTVAGAKDDDERRACSSGMPCARIVARFGRCGPMIR